GARSHARGGRGPVSLREVADRKRLPDFLPHGCHLGIRGDSARVTASLTYHHEGRQRYTTRRHAKLHVDRLVSSERDYIGEERFEADAPGPDAVISRLGELEGAGAACAGDAGGNEVGLARCGSVVAMDLHDHGGERYFGELLGDQYAECLRAGWNWCGENEQRGGLQQANY